MVYMSPEWKVKGLNGKGSFRSDCPTSPLHTTPFNMKTSLALHLTQEECSMPEKIEALVDGGKASAGPPLGPALGPLGVNIGQIVSEINKKTKDFEGMKVPVILTIDPKTKEYTIKVGTPPTSSLILQEINAEKGPGSNDAAVDVPFDKVVKVAKMKRDALLAIDLKAAVKEVLGTAVSMHMTVDGKDPREVQKLINEGQYSAALDTE